MLEQQVERSMNGGDKCRDVGEALEPLPPFCSHSFQAQVVRHDENDKQQQERDEPGVVGGEERDLLGMRKNR